METERERLTERWITAYSQSGYVLIENEPITEYIEETL